MEYERRSQIILPSRSELRNRYDKIILVGVQTYRDDDSIQSKSKINIISAFVWGLPFTKFESLNKQLQGDKLTKHFKTFNEMQSVVLYS